MSTLPMRGYKRKPFPTLDTDKEGIKQFVVDEFQRLENTLETHKQAVDVNTSENEVVKTSVSSLTAAVNNNTSAITNEQTVRASADSALASNITTLTATVTQQGTDLTAAEAAITNEQTVRASADSALATDITSLTSTVNTNNTTLSAAITSEQTARANADSALATDITNLTATVGTNTSSITTEASVRASADSTLQTSVNTAIANAASAQSTADGKIDTFYQTSAPSSASTGDLWFDTDDKKKLYRYDGSSWVAARDSDIAQAITDAAGAQSTADGKVTTFYQNDAPTAEGTGDLWVDTNDGNKLYRWSGSSWLSVQDLTIPALEAKYGVKLNVNGYITGFEQNNDGTTGSFKILADEFKIIDPSASAGSSGTEVFGISNGLVTMQNVKIGTAVIDNLSVTTDKIANNAVTIPSGSTTSTTLSLSTQNTWYTLRQVTFTSAGNPVFLNWDALMSESVSGDPRIGFRLMRDSTVLQQFDSVVLALRETYSGSFLDTGASVGAVTYKIQSRKETTSGQVNAEEAGIIALEVKK